MKGLVCWLLFSLIITAGLVSSNSLEGKHLIVGSQISAGLFHVNVVRNVSGYITEMEGVAVNALAALSQRFHFTYSSLQVNDSIFEKQSESLPGLTYYLATGKCDLVIGSVVMTNNRLLVMDFAEGYAYTTIALIIPMPESFDNAAAIIYPFQIPVWITLILTMPIAAIVIYFSIRPMDRHIVSILHQAIFEMLRVLLNQGGRFQALQRQPVYFVVGSWCLAAFVLGCAYNSILISYILGSNAEPLVNSVTELADNPNIQLVVDKGFGVDVIISAATDGVNKQLGDKLRSNPKSSRCVKRQDCVDLVKSGSYVYIQGLFVAISILDEDFKVTNICQLAFAKKIDPMPGSLAWSLTKKSPYTKFITRGFMELHQAGLIDFWIRVEVQKSRYANFCLDMAEKKLKKKLGIFDNEMQITLKNFTGAFYVLISGYLFSFFSFISENFIFKFITPCQLHLSSDVKRKRQIAQTFTFSRRYSS